MKPSAPTAVPQVLAKLYALALERFPKMTVILGPTGGNEVKSEDETLWIAPGTEGEPGVYVKLARESGLGNAYVETAEVIINYLATGDERTMQALLDKAGAVHAEFRTMLKDHPGLDGLCDQVTLGDVADWHPMQTTDGASVGLGFAVITRTTI